MPELRDAIILRTDRGPTFAVEATPGGVGGLTMTNCVVQPISREDYRRAVRVLRMTIRKGRLRVRFYIGRSKRSHHKAPPFAPTVLAPTVTPTKEGLAQFGPLTKGTHTSGIQEAINLGGEIRLKPAKLGGEVRLTPVKLRPGTFSVSTPIVVPPGVALRGPAKPARAATIKERK